MRPRLMDSFVKCDWRSFQGFKRHRTGQVRHIQQLFGASPANHTGSEGRLRPVQKSQPFFRLKRQWFDTKPVEGFTSGDCCRDSEDFAFSDQNQSQMCERREISAGTDTAAAGDYRIEVAIEDVT